MPKFSTWLCISSFSGRKITGYRETETEEDNEREKRAMMITHQRHRNRNPEKKTMASFYQHCQEPFDQNNFE